jgi:hypothetical protein
MPIYLLDDSLSIDIFYECEDSSFSDCVCISIMESCPENEKLFKADETNIFITPKEARRLAEALLAAAESCGDD